MKASAQQVKEKVFQSPLIYFVCTSSLLAVLLFWSAISACYGRGSTCQRLSFGAIRGMEVIVGGKSYALNFKQQNLAVAFLNAAKPLSSASQKVALWQPDCGVLMLYYFDRDPQAISWAVLEDGALALHFSSSGEEEILLDQSRGAFQTMITQACK